MIKRISSTLIMVLAIVLSCPAFAFSTFASTDNDQVEYMVSVLPNSDKFGSYRTDGRFFDSATYPEHNAVYEGTGASVYTIEYEGMPWHGTDTAIVQKDGRRTCGEMEVCLKLAPLSRGRVGDYLGRIPAR